MNSSMSSISSHFNSNNGLIRDYNFHVTINLGNNQGTCTLITNADDPSDDINSNTQKVSFVIYLHLDGDNPTCSISSINQVVNENSNPNLNNDSPPPIDTEAYYDSMKKKRRLDSINNCSGSYNY